MPAANETLKPSAPPSPPGRITKIHGSSGRQRHSRRARQGRPDLATRCCNACNCFHWRKSFARNILFPCNAVYTATCRKAYGRSEEHTSELQSLMRISYAVFCLKKKTKKKNKN